MPFKSEAQRRFMYMKHPDIAKRWSTEYPNQKDLPMHKAMASALSKMRSKKKKK